MARNAGRGSTAGHSDGTFLAAKSRGGRFGRTSRWGRVMRAIRKALGRSS